LGTLPLGMTLMSQRVSSASVKNVVLVNRPFVPGPSRSKVIPLLSGARTPWGDGCASCELVLLAVPWDNVSGTLASLPKWKNQILIDGPNPFHGKAGKSPPADVENLSTSQLVAALPPGARVVKAFNHMTVPNLEAGNGHRGEPQRLPGMLPRVFA